MISNWKTFLVSCIDKYQQQDLKTFSCQFWCYTSKDINKFIINAKHIHSHFDAE